MKKAFLGLMLVVACLAGLPAYAATYTYDVDYTFAVTTTNKTGSITGFITTILRRLLQSRREQYSVVVIHGKRRHKRQLLKSRPPELALRTICSKRRRRGSSQCTNATNGAIHSVLQRHSGDGADCFPTAGLDVNNLDHGGAMPPTWYIAWVENSGAEATFVDRCRHGFFSYPAIEIASLAVPGTVSLGDDDRRLCRFGLRRPSPAEKARAATSPRAA